MKKKDDCSNLLSHDFPHHATFPDTKCGRCGVTSKEAINTFYKKTDRICLIFFIICYSSAFIFTVVSYLMGWWS